ncbi:hypothetical protein L596_009834 [Steinernema carpocapsae]|uniref:Uncharacterized protein n=1 Tax=Steinernema carpocapsae TaxID=34508 RepID=A0A4U5PGH7_STECR|nr:hypothetical protein L596_009834 [Steinernema carpocapsae]
MKTEKTKNSRNAFSATSALCSTRSDTSSWVFFFSEQTLNCSVFCSPVPLSSFPSAPLFYLFPAMFRSILLLVFCILVLVCAFFIFEKVDKVYEAIPMRHFELYYEDAAEYAELRFKISLKQNLLRHRRELFTDQNCLMHSLRVFQMNFEQAIQDVNADMHLISIVLYLCLPIIIVFFFDQLIRPSLLTIVSNEKTPYDFFPADMLFLSFFFVVAIFVSVKKFIISIMSQSGTPLTRSIERREMEVERCY